MSSLTELFEDLSLRIYVKTEINKIQDEVESAIEIPVNATMTISSINWTIQEVNDEYDFFEVPEEKMNLIAYRQPNITFIDFKADEFTKQFSAPKKNPTYFTLKDVIESIVEFEKEVRHLDARRGADGEIDTQNNLFEGLRCIDNDNQLMFSLTWGY